MRLNMRYGLCIGMFGLVLPQAGLAQNVSAPTRDELARNTARPKPAPEKTPTIDAANVQDRPPCLLADADFADQRFTLEEVHFTGLLDGQDAWLLPSWKALQGQNISVSQICDMRDAAAQTLTARGYIAGVEVPPQDIGSGKITLNVLFAHMTAIEVKGVSGRNKTRIRRILQPLLEQPQFNSIDVERILLLAQDVPGLSTHMTLRPAGTVRGDIVADVAVKYQPITVDASLLNSGPDTAGPFGAIVSVRVNGVLGLGDRTTISAYSSVPLKEQQVIRIEEELQLDHDGTVFVGGWTGAWSSSAFLGQNVLSRTSLTALELRRAIIRKRTRTVSLGLGVELVDQHVRIAGQPFSTDQLKIGYIRLDFDHNIALKTDSVRLGGSISWRKGLSGEMLNCDPARGPCANLPSSRVDADPRAWIMRGHGYLTIPVSSKLTFSVAPRWQYSPQIVPTFEMVTGGNYTIGRGFDPGAITGDSGLGLTTELRLNLSEREGEEQLTARPYLFVDALRTWTHRTPLPIPTTQMLLSAGPGVRLNWGKRIYLDALAAFPARSQNLDLPAQSAKLLIGLTVSFGTNQ
jgi:hemolysin activation/secretion protein